MTMTKKAMPVLKFNPEAEGFDRWFGPTEAKIMEILWDAGAGASISVKRVHRILAENYSHDIAYTSVMTTLVRLYEKDVLTRVKSGLAYIYTPKCTEHEFEEVQIHAIVESLRIGRQSNDESNHPDSPLQLARRSSTERVGNPQLADQS